MISKCLRNWTVPKLQNTYLPRTRPQFEAKRKGLTTGARQDRILHSHCSQHERENRKTGFLSYIPGEIGQEICFVVAIGDKSELKRLRVLSEEKPTR